METIVLENSKNIESSVIGTNSSPSLENDLKKDDPKSNTKLFSTKLINQKSNDIINITQITFKQVFENLIYQSVSSINIDDQQVDIKPDMREYYMYLCKERIDFFVNVDNVLKQIIDNNIILLKNIPSLLDLIVISYKNLKIDKEVLNKEKDIIQSSPTDIIELLFKILLMLFMNTNNIVNENLLEEIMNVVKLSSTLINIKPIKPSVKQKIEKKIEKKLMGLFR